MARRKDDQLPPSQPSSPPIPYAAHNVPFHPSARPLTSSRCKIIRNQETGRLILSQIRHVKKIPTSRYNLGPPFSATLPRHRPPRHRAVAISLLPRGRRIPASLDGALSRRQDGAEVALVYLRPRFGGGGLLEREMDSLCSLRFGAAPPETPGDRDLPRAEPPPPPPRRGAGDGDRETYEPCRPLREPLAGGGEGDRLSAARRGGPGEGERLSAAGRGRRGEGERLLLGERES